MPFDRDRQYAVLKCSIYTGEQIAGFKGNRIFIISLLDFCFLLGYDIQ